MLDFIKIFIVVSALCCMAQVYANGATLDYINIKPNEIFINTNSIAKSKVISDNKIEVTLKNTSITPDFKMNYDSTELNNIVIKQQNNSTKIVFNTPNAKRIKITTLNQTQNNFNYLWFLLCLAPALLYKRKRQQTSIPSQKYTHNIEYILKKKAQNTKDEKIKVVA